MTSLVALCADTASLQHPELLGLAGESLVGQEWLRLFASAGEARTCLRDDSSVEEVWVASCDDVAPINLAATLKRDRADRCVCLVAFEGTGSLKSRASAAGIDASLTRQAFVARYAQRKRRGANRGGRIDIAGRALAPAASWADPLQAEDIARGAAASPAIGSDGGADARADALPRSSAAVSALKATGFLLPVVSASGGAGKSTVAALCALLSQRMGRRTLLLDFDLQFGDMPELLGASGPLAVDEALAAPARLERLAPQGDMPALLAAPERLEQSECVVERAPALIDRLLERFDVVVCNTGAAWAEQHALLLERSSKALFLIDQRPSSLRACRHALDLCARCGIATGPFSFAVNRCSKNALFTSIDVSCALHGAPAIELADGGPDVEELLGAGMPTELLASRNALCASVEKALRGMLPNAGAEPACDATAPRLPGLRFRRSARSRRRKEAATCR